MKLNSFFQFWFIMNSDVLSKDHWEHEKTEGLACHFYSKTSTRKRRKLASDCQKVLRIGSKKTWVSKNKLSFIRWERRLCEEIFQFILIIAR